MSEQAGTALTTASDDGLLGMLERLAHDPAVSVDKLERLLAMQERVMGKRAEDDFNASMLAAQGEMRPVSTDALNPHTSSRYATFAKLDKALRPIYSKNGFSLSFSEGDSAKADHIKVLCYVSHRGGHTRTYSKDVSTDASGPKGGAIMTKAQASGNAQSYGMRYLLKGIFNVAIGEDDDDGNMGAGGPCIADEQAADLEALMQEVGIIGERRDRALKAWKVKKLSEIRARDYEAIVKQVEARRK